MKPSTALSTMMTAIAAPSSASPSANEIAAAPSDRMADQGRMAVDMLVRLLAGEQPGRDFPFRAGPAIPVITPDNIGSYEYQALFGPRDFRPVYNYTASPSPSANP